MTLRELIESDLMRDDHEIILKQSFHGCTAVRRGNWYQDHILNEQNQEIDFLTFNGTTWNIELKAVG